MNKAELIAAVAEKSGLTRKDSEKAVNAAFEAITESLVKGEKVALVGFGAFEVKERAAATEAESTKKAVKKVNSTVEKTTLGDIDALAALKEKLEKGE